MKVSVKYMSPGKGRNGTQEFDLIDGSFDQMVSDLIYQWNQFRMESYAGLPKDWLCDARIVDVKYAG